eukprot:TRINITY_DN32645_c0_g3_i1.p3 TRINITY_DN32645_c0_g3~~TRINITY_DN32645_c0_g3_i1.p3  ORF type:complete len:119 (+),score=10.35 TRINITY_DN32645_c0_g3_i1:679-1035(+)
MHVLEHVPEYEKAIQEAYRVLRPGGVAIIEAPCIHRDFPPTRDCRPLTSTEERTFGCRQPDHIWDFRCDDFFQVVEAAGFLCTDGPWFHDKAFALAVAGREAHIDKPIQKVCTKPFSG